MFPFSRSLLDVRLVAALISTLLAVCMKGIYYLFRNSQISKVVFSLKRLVFIYGFHENVSANGYY